MSHLAPREVVIFGSGGLGREVLWTLRHPETLVLGPTGDPIIPKVLGFLDDNPSNHGRTVNGALVLGGSEWLADRADVLVVVAVGAPTVRQRIVTASRDAPSAFASVVGANSLVGDESIIGVGSILLPGAVVTTNVRIGEFVLLNPTASVSHDCVVGGFTSLGPGVSLAGNGRIGSGCDIGTNASVIPGISIGDATIVGAGACVVRDLPEGVTAVGVPATVIK